MTAEWLIAISSAITLLGVLTGVMWRFSKSVDKNTLLTEQILEAQKSQWNRIDEISCIQDDHRDRIVKIETRLDYAQGKHV
jgi:Tfp pilus assembly protein PilN